MGIPLFIDNQMLLQSGRMNTFLPATLQYALVNELSGPNTVAIILGGSQARGDATPFSDVDIVHLIAVAPASPHRQYRYYDDRLVSVATRTLDWYRTALSQPERAIFVVPSMRDARILLDTNGAFRAFQHELHSFTWEVLQEAANEYAALVVLNGTEEVHKLLSAQVRSDPLATFSVATSLFFDLARAVAVQRGLMITADHTLAEQVRAAVGLDTPWTRAHQQFIAMDTHCSSVAPIHVRVIAALHLYQETVRLFWLILRSDQRAVVEQTVQITQTALEQEQIREDG